MGRPAQKGPALPKLKTLLSNPTTSWTKIIASAWYGHACGSACKRNPVSGVIGVQKGTTIPMV
jgi:hypothetical protein